MSTGAAREITVLSRLGEMHDRVDVVRQALYERRVAEVEREPPHGPVGG